MNPITDIDGQSKIFRLLTGISTCNKKGYKILDVCPYQYGDKIKEPYFYNDSELIFRLRPIPNP